MGTQIWEGEPFYVKDGDQVEFECCACGFVERWTFCIERNKIKITPENLERKTKIVRKKGDTFLQNKSGHLGWKMVRKGKR